MTRIRFKLVKSSLQIISLIFSGFLASVSVNGANFPVLDPSQTQWLGEQIFTNECNRQVACLTAWNEGENFSSMGIGHFIWYQSGQEEIYVESFPDLLLYLQQSGLELPNWILEANKDAPWQNREAFLADYDSARMQELRNFLLNHTREQTDFIITRFESALASMLASVTEADTFSSQGSNVNAVKFKLQENFYRVANSNPPYGLYALIDYVNFKGTGVSPNEAYNNQGWGLKQVLLEMETSTNPIQSFITSARQILANRVENAPVERNESRWLNGWNNRLDTYLPNAEK